MRCLQIGLGCWTAHGSDSMVAQCLTCTSLFSGVHMMKSHLECHGGGLRKLLMELHELTWIMRREKRWTTRSQ